MDVRAKRTGLWLNWRNSAQNVFVVLAIKFPKWYSIHLRSKYDFPQVAAPGNKDKDIQLHHSAQLHRVCLEKLLRDERSRQWAESASC